MKFKKALLTLGLICSTVLTACNYDNSLYNKTYTYKDDVYMDGIYGKWENVGNKTMEEIITEQSANNNIDWDNSGCVNDGFFFASIEKFTARDYNGIINECKTWCKAAFKAKYQDLKIVTSSVTDRKCTITYGGKTTEYTAKPYESNGDDSSFLYLYDAAGDYAGEISVATEAGAGIHNGVVDCLQLKLDYTSRCKFVIQFKAEAYSQVGIAWYCNALIKN